jgi:hypothetical protein
MLIDLEDKLGLQSLWQWRHSNLFPIWQQSIVSRGLEYGNRILLSIH